MEHLQSEEPFSSDPYFRTLRYKRKWFIYRYKCQYKSDGVAIDVGNGIEEGSDSRDDVYVCNEKGKYDMPTDPENNIIFPKCLPRRKWFIYNTLCRSGVWICMKVLGTNSIILVMRKLWRMFPIQQKFHTTAAFLDNSNFWSLDVFLPLCNRPGVKKSSTMDYQKIVWS